MKTIVSILLTALLAFAIGLFELPWYSFAITTFVVFTAIPQKPGKSLLLGFATVFILYFVIALKIDLANEHLLSKKVADIFMLKNNYWLLIIISSFIGGLIAGLSALTGSLLRKAFKKERRAY